MQLSFFNTLTHKTEVFEPLRSGYVMMYSCGPTVYDYSHIGNLRPYVAADITKRALRQNGYQVAHTINITDFGHLVGDGDTGEDKMMTALKREGLPVSLEAMREMTKRYTEVFVADLTALNANEGVTYAPASDYIREEIALITTLHEKGYTYETTDGLYFDISRFPTYGKLGNIDLAALKEGARVEVNPEKRHPADFAVWKKGELGWTSPWGTGFPGWHIECTAMVFATLGKQIDIHTGGEDLVHTHHNGEIAQAEAATGKAPYVRYWMHNAFITIENTKISKSLGNTIRLAQLVERGYSPLALRYWFLTGHYRTPMNFTFDALDGAKQAHYRLRRFVGEELRDVTPGTIVATYRTRFMDAINDDLNTAQAIAILWDFIKDKNISKEDKAATLIFFEETLALGLFNTGTEEVQTLSIETLPSDVQALIRDREAARHEKRWDDADALRQALNLKGYLVEDGPQGAKITKAG